MQRKTQRPTLGIAMFKIATRNLANNLDIDPVALTQAIEGGPQQ